MTSHVRREGDIVRDNLRELIRRFDDGNVLRAATRTGFPHVTLVKILSGGSEQPRTKTLERLAVCFGVDLDELLTDRPVVNGRSIEDEIFHARLLLAQALRRLDLPEWLVNATIDLSAGFDQFGAMIGAWGSFNSAAIERDRAKQTLRYFEVLRAAINQRGAAAVRRDLLENGDRIRLCLSARAAQLAKIGALQIDKLPDVEQSVGGMVPLEVKYDAGTDPLYEMRKAQQRPTTLAALEAKPAAVKKAPKPRVKVKGRRQK